MGLIHLTLGQMAQVTAAWVDPKTDRNAFLSVPEIKEMMSHVERVHNAVLTVQSGPAPQDTSSKEYVKAEKLADRLHDHAYRAFWHLCRANREFMLAQDLVDADALQELDLARSLLMPSAGHGVSEPYLAEAGNAQSAKEKLNTFKGLKETVQKLALATGVSGIDVLNLWFQRAAQLGDLEHQKATQPGDSEESIGALRVRNDWVKVVSTVLNSLEHTKAAAQTVHTVRGPVDSAEETATKSYIARRDTKKASAPATPARNGKNDE